MKFELHGRKCIIGIQDKDGHFLYSSEIDYFSFLFIKYIKNFINDDFLFSRKVNKSYHTKEKKTTKYF